MAAFTVNDIIWVRPLIGTDGRAGFEQIQSGQPGNVVELAQPDDLENGREVHRKFFARIADANNGIGLASFFRLWKGLASDAHQCWFPVPRRWEVADLIGDEQKYGTLTLKFEVSSAETSMTLTAKNSAYVSGFDALLVDGTKGSICLPSQLASVDTALQKYFTVSGAPTPSGLDIVVNLAAAIGANFAAGSIVQTYPIAVDIKTSYSNVVKTNIGTTLFDETQIVLDNIATPTLSVNIVMTSATAFTATGDMSGIVNAGELSLGTGTISADFAPINIFNGSRFIFKLPAGSISGAPVGGDAFSFDIEGAEYPIVLKHTIPPGTVSIASDLADGLLTTAAGSAA